MKSKIQHVKGFITSVFTFSLLMVFPVPSLNARELRTLDAPMNIGPQYPLYTEIASYHPDTAFIMPQGEIKFQISQIKSNSFEFSKNSAKNQDKNAHPSQFINDGSDGYSVYIDLELRTTLYQLKMAPKSWLEVQFSKQTAGMDSSVAMDNAIENFHDSLGMDNYERERAERGQFDLYIYDNETGENIVSISNPEPFEQVVDTYSLKLSLYQSQTMAIAVKSSFAYFYFSRDENTDDPVSVRESHDQNNSLLLSLVFDYVTIHGAYAVTYTGERILPKSPKDLHFYFLGFNAHLNDYFDVVFQTMQYTSIYPDHDEVDGNLSDDIIEVTLGLKAYWDDFASLNLAIVENYSNAGPNNIDVAFYASLEVCF